MLPYRDGDVSVHTAAVLGDAASVACVGHDGGECGSCGSLPEQRLDGASPGRLDRRRDDYQWLHLEQTYMYIIIYHY